jgi:2-polyprenyl-6-methoxyphenol hydroxylase-like FAD-dependent oxidoreductase
MTKSVTIVGGGLAGVTLGIGLRQRGVPVTLWEAGRFPRHRVCGEFISGRGLETLARLGLRALLEDAGAVVARTAAFFSTTSSARPRALPTPALCLSRQVLDALLAKEFCRRGGELRSGERWRDTKFPEGVVRATGRRAQEDEDPARWFGLKAHTRGVALAADLEMHLAPNGYVGLCRLNEGVVNVCGLFRRGGAASYSGGAGWELLRGQPGSPLHQRLGAVQFDEQSLCAVAGLSLRSHRAGERDEFCVGDAISMIPPVTGNGMSMAFESAEWAIEPLTRWSRDEVAWSEAKQTLADCCDTTFARRLAWARWLQTLMLSTRWQRSLVFLAGRSEWLGRFWFGRTR